VQNVQVLATMASPLAAEGSAVDPDTGMPIDDSVVAILAVTPQEAELVRFAQIDGNLSLVLRSPQDASEGPVTTTGVTLRQLVDEHGVLPPRAITSRFP
jgi:Flp pilus assembly protein CpaB